MHVVNTRWCIDVLLVFFIESSEVSPSQLFGGLFP